MFFFFFKQKTAYEMRISDWSSDVCSSDLLRSSLECRIADRSPYRTGAERRSVRRHAVLRSEEHTSELQSLMRISYAVFCLKKKKKKTNIISKHDNVSKDNHLIMIHRTRVKTRHTYRVTDCDRLSQ